MGQLKTLNESFLQQGWTKVDTTDTVKTNVIKLQK